MPPRSKANIRYQKKEEIKERLRKKAAFKKGEKKICITGIMKNESKNVNRLLDSLLPLPPDMISIVDTGSTDNTAELISEWGKKHNIPTVVHNEPFKNFAYNRTHSIKAAKEAFPDADYFLLTDADFLWEIGDFDKTLLIDHKYHIEQYNKFLTYTNIRLLSAEVDFECFGVTHEYWDVAPKQTKYFGPIRTGKITTLRINDLEDGGCKEDKFERDERLLIAGLEDKETSNNLKTRYKFYLAQTLKDMGRYDESIIWYEKRVKDGGWAEEVFYARFMIGFNNEQLGWKKKHVVFLQGKKDKTEEDIKFLDKWNSENAPPDEVFEQSNKHFTEAAVNYMAAYNYRKVRAEPLYYLARMYRCLGLNKQAYDVAIMGKKIPYPKSDGLFINTNCYKFLLDFEISIVAYYIEGKKEEGRRITSELMMRTDLPPDIRRTVENNSRHYL